MVKSYLFLDIFEGKIDRWNLKDEIKEDMRIKIKVFGCMNFEG